MIDDDIQKDTFSYYDERAAEHDLVYLGKGPALQRHAAEYTKDVAAISEVASGFGRGCAIDIACGTGFWSPYYAPNCSQLTFVDQSASMLSECRKRVAALKLAAAPRFVQGDFFNLKLKTSACDTALVGFLLSHFIAEQEEAFFEKLSNILKPTASLMVIDSAWSKEREKHRKKAGIEERKLEDGRRFRVYKRYFEKSEVHAMLERYRYSLQATYFGSMLFAAIADRT